MGFRWNGFKKAPNVTNRSVAVDFLMTNFFLCVTVDKNSKNKESALPAILYSVIMFLNVHDMVSSHLHRWLTDVYSQKQLGKKWRRFIGTTSEPVSEPLWTPNLFRSVTQKYNLVELTLGRNRVCRTFITSQLCSCSEVNFRCRQDERRLVWGITKDGNPILSLPGL